MKVKQLRVYPNPYTAIHRLQGDDDGVTWAGVFPVEVGINDPGGTHGLPPRFVGASVNEKESKKLSDEKTLTVKGKTAVLAYANHDLAYSYSLEPTVVPNTEYYRNAVFQNDLTGQSPLIAADIETARACGLNEKQFIEPRDLLTIFRKQAIEAFAAANSEITVADLEERLPDIFPRSATTKTQAPVTAPTGGNS